MNISRKFCIKCKLEKEYSYFSNDKNRKDGLISTCKACISSYCQQRYNKQKDMILAKQKNYYKNNKEQILIKNKLYCLKNKEKKRQMDHDYYQRNSEKIKLRSKQWIIENRDLHNSYVSNYSRNNRYRVTVKLREWQRKNPDKVRMYAHNRRALKINAPGIFTEDHITNQYNKQNGLCYYCLIPLNHKYHLEHKIPLKRGGTNFPDNIVCSCQTCNSEKWIRTDEEYIARKQK